LFFEWTDVFFTLFFCVEIGIKINDQHGNDKFRSYLKSHWNKIDFISILLALPSVGAVIFHNLEIFAGFTALRSLRVFKFLRIIEYIPSGKHISKQMFKAFRGVSFIIFAFMVYSTVISLISVSLFKEYAPQYFNNAFDAFFTIFKVFSGDGFSDVVSAITYNSSEAFDYFTKFYFVFVVFTGSILGLSLINSIFIDQMSKVEEHIDESEKDVIDVIRKELVVLKEQNNAMMRELEKLNTPKG